MILSILFNSASKNIHYYLYTRNKLSHFSCATQQPQICAIVVLITRIICIHEYHNLYMNKSREKKRRTKQTHQFHKVFSQQCRLFYGHLFYKKLYLKKCLDTCINITQCRKSKHLATKLFIFCNKNVLFRFDNSLKRCFINFFFIYRYEMTHSF